jgi:hypothetical protein
VDWMNAATVLAAVVLGFLARLLTFKRGLRWCRTCGSVLRCPRCVSERDRLRLTGLGMSSRRGWPA